MSKMLNKRSRIKDSFNLSVDSFESNENFFLNNNDLKNDKQTGNFGDLESFQISWKDLTYKVIQKQWFGTDKEKVILNKISGHFKSGAITAILGPSGAGKSTLLSIISGAKKIGLTGSITISTDKKVRFAYISQDDYLLDNLSIRESLLYASRIKNDSQTDHNSIVENILKRLRIKECADNWPKRCSGGQKKRISIALELVSRPNILILDEPTSGLDSVTTWLLMSTLINLTKDPEPLAVVATIHQPSAKLFNKFDSVYIMSNDGQCIYEGSPQSLVGHFGQHGMICPDYYNPADFVLEIASKQHGIEKVMLLSAIHKSQSKEIVEFKHTIRSHVNIRFWNNVWVLTQRSFKTNTRSMFLLYFRIFATIMTSILLSYMYGPDSGSLSGCPKDFYRKQENYFQNYVLVMNELVENGCQLAFMTMFATFVGIFPVVLIFPKEVNILFKEHRNGWYSCAAYLLSKIICDIPFQLILPNLGSVPVYYFTGQYMQPIWRLYYFAFIFILISFNGSAQGLLLSVVFVNHPAVATTLGNIIIVPMMLFSGTLARLDTMPLYLRLITWLNYIRFGDEAFVVSIYGWGRCDDNPLVRNVTDLTDYFREESLLKLYGSDIVSYKTLLTALNFAIGNTDFADKNESHVVAYYGLHDFYLYRGIAMLCIHYVCFRVITYYAILTKYKSRN